MPNICADIYMEFMGPFLPPIPDTLTSIIELYELNHGCVDSPKSTLALKGGIFGGPGFERGEDVPGTSVAGDGLYNI